MGCGAGLAREACESIARADVLEEEKDEKEKEKEEEKEEEEKEERAIFSAGERAAFRPTNLP